MIEKEKISVFQMGMIMYLMNGGTSILLVPTITAQFAGRDMWLSPIFSSLSGFLMVWVAWKLYQLFPEESIIGLSEKILGSVVGKILSFFFLFYILQLGGMVVREYEEFIVGAFFNETPSVVVIGTITLVCAFAVRGGIEVIARCTQIFLPIIFLFSFVMIVLTLSEFDLKNIFPIMEKGWISPVKGAVIPQVWFVEFIFITFLFPVLNRRKKVLRGGVVPVFALMITMVITSLICLFVLGELAEKFTFPVYTVGTYISVADFLEHLDAVIMAIWVGGGFIQISMWYYALVLGTARWLNLSDYRPLVFPIGLLFICFGVWTASNVQEMLLFFSTTLVPYCFTVLAGYPIFLLCVAFVRKWISGKEKQA